MKLDLLVNTEPFSCYINLDNRIRNSIAHYDVEIDDNSQKIKFIDKHRGKERITEIYYIEFAKMCVENFNVCIYILELIYNLRTIYLISMGDIPHIKYEIRQKH